MADIPSSEEAWVTTKSSEELLVFAPQSDLPHTGGSEGSIVNKWKTRSQRTQQDGEMAYNGKKYTESLQQKLNQTISTVVSRTMAAQTTLTTLVHILCTS